MSAVPSPAALSLATLNAMSRDDFVAHLGGIFEHSPWVAERAADARPFDSLTVLHARMVLAVKNASRDEQLRLLCAHPELAGKEAQSGTLTEDSAREQRGAGLINLDAAEKAQISALNAGYRAKHGFPFIIAVRNYTRAQIFSEFQRRLGQDTEREMPACLEQVFTITRLRLEAMLAA
jgi:2-oxo-4-hydroxy-4-carboxy-5-ureidoimidazoline decarboxylase